MTTMFIRHTVANYKAWRKVYDDFAPVQKAKGVTAQAVYQAADNPNDITVTTILQRSKPHTPSSTAKNSKALCRTLALLGHRQSGSPTRYRSRCSGKQPAPLSVNFR